jgi:hypothetical protein
MLHSQLSLKTSNLSSSYLLCSIVTERGRIMLLHRMAIVRLQGEKDDDELGQISQRLSSLGSERAHTLAKAWIVLDN